MIYSVTCNYIVILSIKNKELCSVRELPTITASSLFLSLMFAEAKHPFLRKKNQNFLCYCCDQEYSHLQLQSFVCIFRVPYESEVLEKKKPNLSPPRRLIVDLWQFIIWDTTKSSPRISNPITIFLCMQRDHGKLFASVTIFWFLENLKLKDISVYYYLQRTSMSIKMSEEGEFKSWMCVH